MNFKSFFYFLILLCYSSFSQNSFEKGYLITIEGKKIEGFVDIKSNLKLSAESILYRKDFNAQNEYYQLTMIKEIHLDRGVKYVKELVEYDKDYVDNKLSTSFDKNLSSETVLLEVLLEGEANLYSYEKNDKKLFYVKSTNEPLEYLFYKKATNTSGDQKENAFFRQQLFEKFKCKVDDSIADFLKVNYNTESLVSFFESYNECKGNTSYAQNKSKQKPVFKLAPLMGLLINNIELTSDDSFFQTSEEDYSKTSMFFGVELSVKFPKSNFRYEIFGRLFYNKVDYTKYFFYEDIALNRKIDRQYTFNSGNINFSIGPRYFFNSYSKNRFFVDLALGVIIPNGDLKSKTTFAYATGGTPFEIENETFDTSLNFIPSVGFGYLYANKFGIDIRMDTANNFTKSYTEIKFRQLPFYISVKYLLF